MSVCATDGQRKVSRALLVCSVCFVCVCVCLCVCVCVCPLALSVYGYFCSTAIATTTTTSSTRVDHMVHTCTHTHRHTEQRSSAMKLMFTAIVQTYTCQPIFQIVREADLIRKCATFITKRPKNRSRSSTGRPEREKILAQLCMM